MADDSSSDSPARPDSLFVFDQDTDDGIAGDMVPDPVVIAAGDRLIVNQMADLTGAMTNVADELRRTSPTLEQVDARSKAVDARSKLQTASIGVLFLATIAVGAVGWTGKGIGDQIKSCIDPAGECYRDSRSRAGEVEGRIVADQAARSERNLRAVCALFPGLRQPLPAECPRPEPAIPATSTTR